MIRKAAVFCPNPGVDKLLCLQSPLVPGELHRVARVREMPGSKGANVALALSAAGIPTVCFTFSGGALGKRAEEMLTRGGVTVDAVKTAAGVRENIKLADPDGKSTEINERGGLFTEAEAEELLSRLKKGGYDALFLCGSLPEGVASDYYARAIGIAEACGARTFLDTSGEALRRGVLAAPDYIKPNLTELAELTGRERPADLKSAVDLAEQWQREHPRTHVILTAGEHGSAFCGREGSFVLEALRVQVCCTVGAGDAFLAGFAGAILKGAHPREALLAGREAATARVMTKA